MCKVVGLSSGIARGVSNLKTYYQKPTIGTAVRAWGLI